VLIVPVLETKGLGWSMPNGFLIQWGLWVWWSCRRCWGRSAGVWWKVRRP